ncbi:MAG TPA: hypothetical protein VFV71_00805 [Burkholderiales bacterium]|nr:hypothetical protein [Burkholderiales bacterium]
MHSLPSHESPRYWLNKTCGAGVILLLAIIVSSAWLRLNASVPDCSGNTACVPVVADADGQSQRAGNRAVRIVHRVSASAAGAVAMLALLLASVSRPRIRSEVAGAVAIVTLTLMLAVVGRWSKGTQLPVVTLLNVLGAMMLVALLYWLWRRTSMPAGIAQAHRAGFAAAAALALALAAIALGVLTSAGRVTPASLVFAREGLATVHLACGSALVLLTGTLALRRGVLRSPPMLAFVMATTQAVLGWMSSGERSVTMVLAHNLAAAILLMTLVATVHPGHAEVARDRLC